MSPSLLFVVLLALAVFGYFMGRAAAVGTGRLTNEKLHSLPSYYGYYAALWCAIPCLLLFGIWLAAEDWLVKTMVVSQLPPDLAGLPQDRLNLVIADIRNMAYGNIASGQATPQMQSAVEAYKNLQRISNTAMWGLVAVGLAALLVARRRIHPKLRARNSVETVLTIILIISSTVAVFTTIGIVLSLLFESLRFFARIPPTDFLFGLTWSPQTAIRADQIGASGAFGAIPLFTGTLLIAGIAMLTAVPIGLMSAVYMSEYSAPRIRAVVKPMLEVLAGIPTVVYGFFAALVVAPFVADVGRSLGLAVASQSALAAGLVMGIMIIPFVSSLSDDVISAVPQSLREGSYGLGATKAETIKQVLLPAALPGIMASVILAFSRALGETMIVVMAAGLAANITINPLASVTTITVHIAALLVGDQEFDSPKTLSAFALGLVLFAITLTLNIFALQLVKRYREQYD